MFRKEAEWLRAVLAEKPAAELSPLLNLGSGNRHLRTVRKPWIEAEVFAPLAARGVRVVHADRLAADGVDLASDLLDDREFERLQQIEPRAALCCNLMEHLPERVEFARRCAALLPGGALLIFTGPYSHPHHRDPIDTMFRPTPQEAAALFPCMTMLDGRIIDVGESYCDSVAERPWILLRHVARFPFPFLGFEKWKRSMKKLYWLANNYQVSCAVLRKDG